MAEQTTPVPSSTTGVPSAADASPIIGTPSAIGAPSASGIALAVSAYAIWGLTPIYWKALSSIPAVEILVPRVFWTTCLLLLGAGLAGRQAETWTRDLRIWAWAFVAALLLALNWGVFIYAVQSQQILATSLGYYINPLVSILLGLLVLGERLNRIQAFAVLLAGVGVASMGIQAGSLPWVSLVLASSFALYGLIHKLSPQPPFAGLSREMLVLCPVALAGAVWLASSESSALFAAPASMQAFLSLAGIVTAAPLLLFHGATRRLPLIAVGMFQYIAPTLSLLLAVARYGETFSAAHALGFGCVWMGLVVFSADAIRRSRATARLV